MWFENLQKLLKNIYKREIKINGCMEMKMLREWDELPQYMQTKEVRPYYDGLKKKQLSLFLKRIFDLGMSSIMLVLLAPVMFVIAILISTDSKGGVFFRQERVTQYGKKFRIHKFRTMIADAEKIGSAVTVKNDVRITKVGTVLRKYRIDEFPQLLDVWQGNMSFVGTRPESLKYVRQYSKEMMATLLLPAGITSEASIKYKDEAKLLENAEDVDDVYMKEILPWKMKYNLDSIKRFSFLREIGMILKTVIAVIR